MVLRRGSELLHIYDRDLAQRLVAPLGPSSACWPAEAVLPHLAGCAAAVGARAAELTALLGQPTLCKGSRSAPRNRAQGASEAGA